MLYVAQASVPSQISCTASTELFSVLVQTVYTSVFVILLYDCVSYMTDIVTDALGKCPAILTSEVLL